MPKRMVSFRVCVVGFFVGLAVCMGSTDRVFGESAKLPKGMELYEERYDDGSLWISGSLLHQKRHGIFKEFDTKGRLMWEREYKDGDLDGISRKYYETGEKNGEWNFRNGRLVGVSKEYYQAGMVLRTWDYRQERKTGIVEVKDFYRDGSLFQERTFKNNMLVHSTMYPRKTAAASAAASNIPKIPNALSRKGKGQ